MKKHINLLTKKKDYLQKERAFSFLRRTTAIVGVITFLSVLLIFFLNTRLTNDYNRLLKTKEQLLSSLLATQETQNKLTFVTQRHTLIETLSRQDLNFSAYYALLERSVLKDFNQNTTNSATIESMSFDNKREFSIVLHINDEAHLFSILTSLEDDEFQKQFEKVEIERVTLTSSINTRYELLLTGVFKQLHGSI